MIDRSNLSKLKTLTVGLGFDFSLHSNVVDWPKSTTLGFGFSKNVGAQPSTFDSTVKTA